MKFKKGDMAWVESGVAAGEIVKVVRIQESGSLKDFAFVYHIASGLRSFIYLSQLKKIEMHPDQTDQTDQTEPADPHAGMIFCEYTDRWVWF